MKKYISLSLIALVLILIWSCSPTLSEDEYYNKATQAYAKNEYKQAIENFKLLVDHYPNGQKTAEASFMLGFINANDLKDLVAAEKYYKAFIEKYPNHELTDDAQYELKNLGKDVNELDMFKKMGADSGEAPVAQ